MRDRTKEVEKLKKQLQQLQQSMSADPSTTPPPEHDLSSGGRSPSNIGDVHSSGADVTASTTPNGSRRVNDYLQNWSHTSGAEQLHGLGLTTDGESSLGYDSASYFPQIQTSNDVVTDLPITSRRARAVTANVPSTHISHSHHLRSNSIPPIYSSTCHSPMPWGQGAAADNHDGLRVSTR